jgi:hypothetical protein
VGMHWVEHIEYFGLRSFAGVIYHGERHYRYEFRNTSMTQLRRGMSRSDLPYPANSLKSQTVSDKICDDYLQENVDSAA